MKEFDLIAVIAGQHPMPPLPDLQMVPHGGMTAVMTTAPRPVLRLPQSRRQTLVEAATRLAWQEACMPLGTVLPARQDSPLTLDAAVDFLTANHPFLTHLMQRFKGLAQVQVTVSWTESGVLTRFRDAPELATVFAATAIQPEALASAVQNLANRLAGGIGQGLAAVSVETAALPLAPAMLWNGAVLVPLAQMDALNSAVEAVDAIWPEGLQIRQIGPAPAGSFATLALERVSQRQIATAMAAFGLASLAEVDQLAARRRDRLMTTTEADQRDGLRRQADLVAAAARLPMAKGFSWAGVWAEGLSAPQQREVA